MVVAMTSRRPVGAVDTMWLNMDRPNNLMVIDSVMWFDEPVDWERFAALVETRLIARYPVFRQRPVGSFAGLGRQYWEDDPEFSLSRHLHRVMLPPPGDEACLERFVEAQMNRPLDRDRPLWEFYVVDGYRSGAAVVTRFHHAIADGAALAEVLLSLTDATMTADLEELPGPDTRAEAASAFSARGVPGLDASLTLLSAISRVARPARLLDTLTLPGRPVTWRTSCCSGRTPGPP